MNPKPALPRLLLCALLAGLTACGETDSSGATVVEIASDGDEMRYDRTAFTVRAGQEVRLVFRNRATIPAMQHNVVVLRQADAVTRVGTAAISAGVAKGFVPDDPMVLAHTPLAAPGETVEVTFTAPAAPGDYPFICTFPGHYVLMQGVMHVVSGESS